MTREELEKLAAAEGVKPATLRMRLYREGLRARAKSYQEPAFETFGLKLNAEFAAQLKATRRRLEHAATQVGKARIEVERLLRSELPVPLSQLETIEGLCLSLEERIAEAMPRSLCPYCKGVDRVQTDCKACKGTGLASVAQFARAPKDLKQADAVVYDGKVRSIDEFAVAPKPDPFET